MKKYLLIIIIFLIVGCHGMFFHPDKNLYYNPEICQQQPKNYEIDSSDNTTLHAWLFRTNHKEPKGTIIFMHGNSRNMTTESLGMLWVLEKGYNLFTFDYRGYGVSTGKPSIKGVMEDGVEALDGFMQIKDLDKSNIIIWGQSLGGAVASYTAANSPHADKVKLLVMDSTFTSWRDIAKDYAASIFITWPFQYPISWSFPDDTSSKNYLPVSKIKNTLIIHSKADTLIKYSHGEKLYEVANEPKKIILFDYAKHARILLNPTNIPVIIDYIDKVVTSKE